MKFTCGEVMKSFLFQGGQYILTLMDWYIGSTALMVVGLLEPIIISYIYGKKDASDFMTDRLFLCENCAVARVAEVSHCTL